MRLIETYFMIFFIYAFAGWLMESFSSIFYKGVNRFVNRGFLIGPYCPVYGLGVLSITILLKPFTEQFWLLFVLAIIISGVLEYSTSFIMEKLFDARWWDYTHMKFNLNGRICLETLLPFGIVGSVILRFINPFIEECLDKIPDMYMHYIAWGLFGIIVVDTTISCIIAKRLKAISAEIVVETVKDDTIDVNKGRQKLALGLKEKVSIEISESNQRFKRKLKENAQIITVKITGTPKEIAGKIKGTPKEIAGKIKVGSKIIVNNAKFISNKVKNVAAKTISIEELQNKIKSKFASESYLNRRITNAFPNLRINFKAIILPEKLKSKKTKEKIEEEPKDSK